MMKSYKEICMILVCMILSLMFAQQVVAKNETISSFSQAKKRLLKQVYPDHRKTIYCDAAFMPDKTVRLPEGFVTTKYVKRASRIEWEHVVPAENFGRSFKEWRDGDDRCVNKKGKSFRGRKCAEKVNMDYRYMQSDMHNLFPAIGAVNAMRSNYNFRMLPGESSSFGACEMIISSRKAQPPEIARGRIARTYKYMDWAYPRYSMSKQQKQLMNAWDQMYPVSEWECIRASRIKVIQGNENSFVGSCPAVN